MIKYSWYSNFKLEIQISIPNFNDTLFISLFKKKVLKYRCLTFELLISGAGLGITMSSNTIALNAYFKKKIRIAISLSWTCTGIGPIIMPQVSKYNLYKRK